MSKIDEYHCYTSVTSGLLLLGTSIVVVGCYWALVQYRTTYEERTTKSTLRTQVKSSSESSHALPTSQIGAARARAGVWRPLVDGEFDTEPRASLARIV